MGAKFKPGDEVKIVLYGSCMWTQIGTLEDKMFSSFPIICSAKIGNIEVNFRDSNPSLVGQKGIVQETTCIQDKWKYVLKGPNKVAWYHEEQLELVK